MKRLLIYILLLLASNCIAQTTREQVMAFENDVKAYESAVTKIVKQKNYDDGIAELSVLINRCEKDKNYSPTLLASFYKGRGNGLFMSKNYPKSISDYKKAIDLLEKSGDEGVADLSDAWYQLSLAYYYDKKPAETMDAANKCVETAEDYFGGYHSKTLDAYSLRSNYEGFYKKGKEALRDRKKIFEIIQNNVERNFTYLTATERTAYWEKYLPETTIMFAFAHKLEEQQSDFTDVLFNQQLLAKGLLLTAESALQRAIDSNPVLSSAYQQIRSLRKKASDSKIFPKDAEDAILEADRIERNLGTSANSLHQFMDFLKVHVSDVKNNLGKEDIAVEFVDYRIGKDSIMYAALLLAPKWEHARFIPLLEKKEIEANQDNLADHIWKPILDVLGYSPKKIYFAPSGLLYLIPIESHYLSDGRLMCDAFNMYRVSSTRWLCTDGKGTQSLEAVIYGGILYDEFVNQNSNQHKKDNQRGYRESSNIIQYLPATLTEAQSVNSIIYHHPFTKCTLLTGNRASEESFKSLTGKQIQLIHIATHGYYDNREGVADVLSRSGLCFVGANSVFNETIPTKDGILTASEISDIDLKGLELITLSACETGLGNITNDGVWGLQRGFKKAGAQSILMSLWKVDDEATCVLMTEFYNNWANGKNKHQALELAKQKVRSQKGWEDPKYWAAFILLDGINQNI